MSSHATEIALAALAHDIRTPLTGILALADLLNASDLPQREQRWAAAIKDSAEHLARLTTLVVDAAKAEAGGLVLRPERFSPRGLALAIGNALAARAEAKNIGARIVLADSVPEQAAGDAVRLRSALENLIDNAVKFTERGEVGLEVAASRVARGRLRLRFIVTDSGIGIVPRDLKRLFRPFTQASEEVARRFGGAGLGLVYVKRLAEAMGGTLAVTSRPGQGSRFDLTVTVDRLDEASAPAPAASAAGLRVLCVEDNPYGRIVLKAVLEELGHQVGFVGSGEAAIEQAGTGLYDVVLMDIALPGIDGIEATRRIRALPPPARQIPIIGVSGRTAADDAAAATAAGMDRYLRKPASPAELNEAMAQIARVRRA
jgi:CheY-like chemotaxis protein